MNSGDVNAAIKEGSQCDASAASIGTGASFDTSYLTTESKQHLLADYHKKDVSIWHRSDDDSQEEICVRVQVWDMNLSLTQPTDAADDAFCARSINSSPIKVDQSPLISLLKRCQGVIITMPCPPPPSTASFSWPELDAVENSIENWISLCECSHGPIKITTIHHFNNAHSRRSNSLHVLSPKTPPTVQMNAYPLPSIQHSFLETE